MDSCKTSKGKPVSLDWFQWGGCDRFFDEHGSFAMVSQALKELGGQLENLWGSPSIWIGSNGVIVLSSGFRPFKMLYLNTQNNIFSFFWYKQQFQLQVK